ncbi:MAG TPA: hypothetical protein VNE38_06450 [Ktedonobacteraceae bacterium]|nr:hypothetical protein [Ktedonobacteraceae bacterium]
MNTSLEARHMKTWSRAAQASARYTRMDVGEQGGPEGLAARAILIAELAALLEIAQQLDKELPLWQKELYVKAAQGMVEACHLSMEEIAAFTAALKPRARGSSSPA